MNLRQLTVESAPAQRSRDFQKRTSANSGNKRVEQTTSLSPVIHLKTSLTDATNLTRHLRKQPFPAQTCRGFSRVSAFPLRRRRRGWVGGGVVHIHYCTHALSRYGGGRDRLHLNCTKPSAGWISGRHPERTQKAVHDARMVMHMKPCMKMDVGPSRLQGELAC